MTDTQPTDPNYSQRLALIRELHQSPTMLVLATTGGGSLVIGDLCSVPGGSQTLLEAVVPYTRASITRFVARVPGQYCSVRTARQLAMAAFQRGQYLLDVNRSGDKILSEAVHYAEYDDSKGAIVVGSPFNYRLTERVDLADSIGLIGVGCTASLVTDQEKKGEHRLHIATQTLRRTTTCSLRLLKGARNRLEEERLAADLIVNMILNAREELPTNEPLNDDGEKSHPFLAGTSKKIEIREVLPLGLRDSEKVIGRRTIVSLPLLDLFFGKNSAVLWRNGKIQYRREVGSSQRPAFNPYAECSQAIFSGSFNPIHEAHRQMVEISQERLGNRVSLEIAVQSVDKPMLDYIDLEDRLEKIEAMIPGQVVWLTRTKMFEEKADLFRETMFVVGADTLRRFADLRFYSGSIRRLHDVLRMIAYRNCRFLVFARRGEGVLETMKTLQIPDMLRSLCDEVPVDEFAVNLSSSGIREQEDNQ